MGKKNKRPRGTKSFKNVLLSWKEKISSGNGLFFLFYAILIVAIYNVKIIKRFGHAFKMLFGKVNYWFVFSKTGDIVDLPKPSEPGGELPTYPEPDIEIPLVTWGYWREILNNIIRGAILITIAILLLVIFIQVLKWLEIRSKRQTTGLYKLYVKTLKKPLHRMYEALNKAVTYVMNKVLDKKNLTLLVLITLLINGVLINILAGLAVSIHALFLTGPFNWMWLHFKATIYYLAVFVSKFTVINVFLFLFILYNVVAFGFAYKEKSKNELLQEEFVDNISFGVGMAGGSGKGKTTTGKVLADASQRSAKKHIKKDNKDIEAAYSAYIEFSDVRRFFDENREEILDEIDAENYAEAYIYKYNVKDIELDRFVGKTPSLHEQLKWYFIGLWILKPETTLIQSAVPMIVNDPMSSKEIRNSIFDILTLRREDKYSLMLDQNLIKSSLDNIESELENGKRIFKIKEGVETKDINLSAFPGLTVFWPELDKDFPFNERGQILEAQIDKLLGIFRHFTAFKQKTIGHFIYDSQQRDGVANVIRTKFDSVLKILRQDKGKRSLFIIPYITYCERQIRFYQKIKDALIVGAPYKRSFFRIFIETRIRRLNRINDYLHSFDYIDMHVVLVDAGGANIDTGGKALKRLRINLANAYFTFPSVVYQDPYKEAKIRFPQAKSVKDLKHWDQLKMKLSDIDEMNSPFLKTVFLGDKGTDKKKTKKPKKDSKALL